MRRSGRLERGQERAQAPDAAEVVRPRHGLDQLRVGAQEAASARDPGAVHEQPDLRMALADRGGNAFDLRAVADVAALPLRAELLRHRAQALLSARDQDAAPPSLRQLPGDRGADAARAAGDDRYLRHTRTTRCACARRPRRSVRTTRSTCRPREAFFGLQVAP